MNRSDLVQRIIFLDQVEKQIKAESQALRSVLMLDAKAEYEEQGAAPTWRMPDLATVATAVTHTSVSVADEAAFRAWVAKRYPEEVYTVSRVREAWQAAFLGALSEDFDPVTGEVIPGLRVKEGGEFSGISIRATAAAKELFGMLAANALGELTDRRHEAAQAIAELAHG